MRKQLCDAVRQLAAAVVSAAGPAGDVSNPKQTFNSENQVEKLDVNPLVAQ